MSIAAAAVKKRHLHMGHDVLIWFDRQYPKSSFHGRFQIGIRKAGEQGIFPLFTGERDAVRTFLEQMNISPKIDYYITANSVSGVKRTADQLFSLHNIVMDVDAHQEDDEEEALQALWWRMKRDLFLTDELPEPTSVIQTGRGLQLWWSIVPISFRCSCYHEEITNAFADKIKAFLGEHSELSIFHVDRAASQNPIGYFRLPGTYNTKSGTEAELLFCQDKQYSTHVLLPLVKSWQREKKKSPFHRQEDRFAGQYAEEDIYLLKDIRTTGFFRVRQMIQLRMLRNNEIGKETRNNFCLIVYNAMVRSLSHEEAWEKLLVFNRGFKKPMTEKELHQTIDTSHKKNGYCYKNKTIISFLDITPEEQEAIGLYEPTVPYRELTRLSGHPSRKAAARTVKQDRNQKILALAQQGINRKEIADTLSIHRNTVSAVLGKNTDRYAEAVTLFEAGMELKRIALHLGVSLRSVQRYKKKWEATSAEKLPYI